MASHIENAIHKIENVIKNGKLKHKKIKLKTTASKEATGQPSEVKEVKSEVAKVINDNIPRIERDKICKNARKEAHSPVADMKRDLSNEVRKDLGLE